MENDLILALETATRGGSLALLRGATLLASSTGIAEESHSVNLLSRIELLLKEANVTLRDVDMFAIASGPGSFTGLRIGLATMKAFAAVFDRPCVGVPTLEAIAFSAGEAEFTYALLPAGRGEVFAWERSWERGHPARSCDNDNLSIATQRPRWPRSQAEHIPPHVLLERITEQRSIHWAGPGAHLYKELIRNRAEELQITFVELNGKNPTVREGPSPSSAGLRITDDSRKNSAASNQFLWTLAPNVEQLAEYVAILALERSNDTDTHKPEDLRAIYVRPSDAEMKNI